MYLYPFMACLTVINMSKFDITLLSLLMMKLARDWKYCKVGWSDIAIFFENGHYAADQVYFYESNSKNRRIWQRARQIFHFQKIKGILNKMFGKFANTFLLLQEQSTKK